ncbi:Nucleotide-binding universal stress protein, UspA family [Polaribacter sp. KT25b]|uniref:universal stress protein n=1 Tax=Polaribacter sp. KT25b TaxID=1855336 RepID=UPI00087DE71C|nr:universal stress protein [Polaribacter sp. KT25b]SDR67158.1 Nucleotide-binding universal stress protein, UspA family [Polaribacter sp. KT25b]
MKHILLPTDFSKNADNAISYAVQLYKNEVCRFYILHTDIPISSGAEDLVDSYSILTLQEIQKEAAKQKLKKIEDQLKKKFNNANHSFIPMASFNLFISEMRRVIKENNIDLIIMGTKGATGAKEIFIGTNTMQTIKKLKCPVIAIPSDFKYEKPNEVLFPTNYEAIKSNKYLPLIKKICKEHKSKLHILNVYQDIPLKEKQEKIETFLDTYFKDTHHFFHSSEKHDLIEAIEDFEIENRINFLIMIQNHHNFFENLLFKPIVNQMVYHTNIPFLVIPSNELIKN